MSKERKAQTLELTPKQVMEHLAEAVGEAHAFFSIIIDQNNGVSFGSYNLNYEETQQLLDQIKEVVREQREDYEAEPEDISSEEDPGWAADAEPEVVLDISEHIKDDNPHLFGPSRTLH